MHPIETRIRNSKIFREELNTLMPSDAILGRAYLLLGGDICYKDIPLAVEYYMSYLKEPGSIRHSAFDAYMQDMLLIQSIEKHYNKKEYRAVTALVAKLSVNDYAVVLYMLAIIYDQDSSNKDQVITLLTQASELGYPPAMDLLATIYQKDELIANRDKAIILLEHSSSLGSEAATDRLTTIYLTAETTNLEKAHFYSEKLFDSKVHAARAMYNVGRLLEEGAGKPKDIFRAKELYERSSELGGCAFSMVALGLLLLNNKTAVYDPKRGLDVLRGAQKSGNMIATVYLADTYNTGVPSVLKRDVSIALELLEKVEASNDITALIMLGKRYQNNPNIQNFIDKAFICFNKAASLGSKEAIRYADQLRAHSAKEYKGSGKGKMPAIPEECSIFKSEKENSKEVDFKKRKAEAEESPVAAKYNASASHP